MLNKVVGCIEEKEIISYLKGFINKDDVLIPNIINNYKLDTYKKTLSFNLCKNREIIFIDCVPFPKGGTKILLCKDKVCIDSIFLEGIFYNYSLYNEECIEKILLKLVKQIN